MFLTYCRYFGIIYEPILQVKSVHEANCRYFDTMYGAKKPVYVT